MSEPTAHQRKQFESGEARIRAGNFFYCALHFPPVPHTTGALEESGALWGTKNSPPGRAEINPPNREGELTIILYIICTIIS